MIKKKRKTHTRVGLRRLPHYDKKKRKTDRNRAGRDCNMLYYNMIYDIGRDDSPLHRQHPRHTSKELRMRQARETKASRVEAAREGLMDERHGVTRGNC